LLAPNARRLTPHPPDRDAETGAPTVGSIFIEEPTSEREIMNIEEARKIAATKIEELAQELQHGQSETLTTYLAAMAKFPRYSVNNMLLILAQKPDAERCAGLRTWNRLGRRVLKGEHAISILAPVIGRRGHADAVRGTRPDDESKEKDGDWDDIVVGFRGARIFDISQTDGAPVPSFASVAGDPGPYTDRLAAFATAKGIKLEYSRRIAPALGACIGDTIVLLPDLPPAEHLSTLAHELGHSLLHRNEGRESLSRTVREAEAEAIAFVVSEAIGLDSIAASVDYVTLYRGDTKTLAASLERIQRTAAEIITAIGPDV
jgi:antirestriction protein ArdC